MSADDRDNEQTGAPLVVTISGSPSPNSRTWLLTREVGAWLAEEGFDVNALDIRTLSPEALMFGRADVPEVRAALSLVEAADGLVIATPIFKASFSGLLKAFLDLLPQFGLTGKTVLPLAVGGSMAHVLAIDYGLRPVLCSMAAEQIVTGVFCLDKTLSRTDGGGLTIDGDVERLLRGAVRQFSSGVRRRAPAPVRAPRPRPSGDVPTQVELG